MRQFNVTVCFSVICSCMVNAESWILTKILVFQVSMINLKRSKRVKGIYKGIMIKAGHQI